MGLLDCPSCFEYSGQTCADYLRHIRLFHADVKPFRFCCNLGCGRERPFNSFFTFRDHVYALHSGVTQKLSTPNEEDGVSRLESDIPESVDESFELPIPTDAEPVNEPMNSVLLLKKAAATFILEVQEKHCLPQSTMENIIKEVDSLYQVNLK